MSTQTIDTLKIPDTVAILQLNCRRSPSILNLLINDENIANFLFLALQEPPINSYTHGPPEQSGWHLVVNRPPTNSEDTRPRSCLYINSNHSVDIQPITSTSRDISACVIKKDDLHMLIVNV